MKHYSAKKLALAGMFCAVAVVGSVFSFPVFGSKCAPVQLSLIHILKKTYKDAKLDCLLCLGGNGTHKTANLLSQEGLNIIGLPKTIDNDIYGTDVTFGFHTAVDIATDRCV